MLGLAFLLVFTLKCVDSQHSLCKKPVPEWTCEDYEENFMHHHGLNLPETLQCLKYKKFESPKVAGHHKTADTLMTTARLRKINTLDTSTLVTSITYDANRLAVDTLMNRKWSWILKLTWNGGIRGCSFPAIATQTVPWHPWISTPRFLRTCGILICMSMTFPRLSLLSSFSLQVIWHWIR